MAEHCWALGCVNPACDGLTHTRLTGRVWVERQDGANPRRAGRFERVPAYPVLVSTVDHQSVLGDREVTGEYAFVLGDPDELALIVDGSEAELRDWVRMMALHVGLRAVEADRP